MVSTDMHVVMNSVAKARQFANSEKGRRVRLAKMDNGTVRVLVVYRVDHGAKRIFDPLLGYAYPEAKYPEYTRCRIKNEIPLGPKSNVDAALKRLFGRSKDAIEGCKELKEGYVVTPY